MKTKLLILTTDSSWGGTEKMIYSLVKELSQRNLEVHLITLIGDGTLIEMAKEYCSYAENLDLKSKLDIRGLLRLFRYIRKQRFHLLHTFLFHANILGRVFGRWFRIPVIISSQRNVDPWRKYFHVFLDRWTSRWCDLVISNSFAGSDRLKKIEKISKVITIPNGIEDVDRFGLTSPQAVKMQHGMTEWTVVGMVANFRPHKGHQLFLEVAQQLLRNNTKLHFVIAGDGRMRQSLESKYSHKNIHFLGHVDDVNQLLELLDIFVLASEWEGMPVSIMEAMLAEVPIIATSVGDIPQLITHQQEGLLIEPKDQEALISSIEWILAHPDEAKQMAQNAKNKVQNKFSLTKMIESTVSVYSDLLKQKGIS